MRIAELVASATCKPTERLAFRRRAAKAQPRPYLHLFSTRLSRNRLLFYMSRRALVLGHRSSLL